MLNLADFTNMSAAVQFCAQAHHYAFDSKVNEATWNAILELLKAMGARDIATHVVEVDVRLGDNTIQTWIFDSHNWRLKETT